MGCGIMRMVRGIMAMGCRICRGLLKQERRSAKMNIGIIGVKKDWHVKGEEHDGF